MGDTLRKLVRDNLVKVLEDSALFAYVATFADEPVERRHRFPSVIVHPVDDMPAADGAGVMGAQGRTATFALEIFAREAEKASVMDDVEFLLGRVIRAVLADPQRAGAAIDSAIGAVTFLLVTTGQRLAGVEVLVHVKYRHQYGQPELAI